MANPRALALAAGILWGAVFFLTTLLSVASGEMQFGRQYLEVYGSIHPGYAVSVAGAFIGLLYAFVCAYAGAYILGALYNKFSKKLR